MAEGGEMLMWSSAPAVTVRSAVPFSTPSSAITLWVPAALTVQTLAAQGADRSLST